MGPTKAVQRTIEESGEIIPAKAEIVPANPTSILELAVRQGANVDTLAKLLELQERFEANQARKAFEEDFSAFKAEAPKLERTRGVSYDKGRTEAYKYTPLSEVAEKVNPVLQRHRLNYNWKQANEGMTITVTCILRHSQGHSIECTLSANADDSGGKNKIQAVGSAVSYLRRYTLLGVLGMATGDEDTDGVAMAGAADFVSSIESSSNMHELERNYKEAIKGAVLNGDAKAAKLFKEVAEKRKSELAA